MTMFKAMRTFRCKAGIIGACLCALMLLGGCSAVRIGYNQASTLTWWWLDGYFDFNAAQEPQVKAALQQWFDWHRRTQLADYADLLAAAQVQVLQPATPQQVCRWAELLRARLDTAVAYGVPLAAELLPTLNAANLAQLQRRYETSNQDFERDFLQPPGERLQASVQRTIDRAQLLYGRLDARQRELVVAGVADSPFDPAAWYAERRALQVRTLQTLTTATAAAAPSAGRDANLARLQTLAERWQRAPPGDYRDYQQRLAIYNCAFIAQLHNSTTPAQRSHAHERLRGWERDLRALASDRAGAASALAP